MMGRNESEVVEMLRAAKSLYGVGDGRKTRTMIDAVRDVYLKMRYPSFEGDWRWSAAVAALTEAAGATDKFGGFQTWEDEEGRTIEERLAAFDRVIELTAGMQSNTWRTLLRSRKQHSSVQAVSELP